jgi:hypothetical protein
MVEAFAWSQAASYALGMDARDLENVKTVVEAVTTGDERVSEPRSVGDAIGAMIAGGRAAQLMSSSAALFEAGGRVLLDEGTRLLVRNTAQRGAEHAFSYAAGPLLGPAAAARLRRLLMAAGGVASAARPLAVRAAATEVLKGAGRAGGLGFVIGGAIATLDAVVAVRDGAMDRRAAATHVVREAATGGASTGVGVLLGVSVVALTGGVAAPVVFAVGAFGAMGAKRMLRHMSGRRGGRAPQPRPITPD